MGHYSQYHFSPHEQSPLSWPSVTAPLATMTALGRPLDSPSSRHEAYADLPRAQWFDICFMHASCAVTFRSHGL
eukprot:5226143-Pyramimonas_sp.AAC.1